MKSKFGASFDQLLVGRDTLLEVCRHSNPAPLGMDEALLIIGKATQWCRVLCIATTLTAISFGLGKH